MQNFRMLFGRKLIPVYLSKLFAEYKFSLKLRVRSENKTIIGLEKFDIQSSLKCFLLAGCGVWTSTSRAVFDKIDKTSGGHG